MHRSAIIRLLSPDLLCSLPMVVLARPPQVLPQTSSLYPPPWFSLLYIFSKIVVAAESIPQTQLLCLFLILPLPFPQTKLRTTCGSCGGLFACTRSLFCLWPLPRVDTCCIGPFPPSAETPFLATDPASPSCVPLPSIGGPAHENQPTSHSHAAETESGGGSSWGDFETLGDSGTSACAALVSLPSLPRHSEAAYVCARAQGAAKAAARMQRPYLPREGKLQSVHACLL